MSNRFIIKLNNTKKGSEIQPNHQNLCAWTDLVQLRYEQKQVVAQQLIRCENAGCDWSTSQPMESMYH